jgi:hypothetical protein
MELADLAPDAYSDLEAQRQANLDEFKRYLEDIGETDVPLGVPSTGDQSAVWAIVAILTITGLYVLNALDRKKHHKK